MCVYSFFLSCALSLSLPCSGVSNVIWNIRRILKWCVCAHDCQNYHLAVDFLWRKDRLTHRQCLHKATFYLNLLPIDLIILIIIIVVLYELIDWKEEEEELNSLLGSIEICSMKILFRFIRPTKNKNFFVNSIHLIIITINNQKNPIRFIITIPNKRIHHLLHQ